MRKGEKLYPEKHLHKSHEEQKQETYNGNSNVEFIGWVGLFTLDDEIYKVYDAAKDTSVTCKKKDTAEKVIGQAVYNYLKTEDKW